MLKKPDDPQSRWIGQGFEHPIDGLKFSIHICLDKYSIAPP